ncbi:Ham1-like protein [mine drainage metagenome]|uniref:dITP/XTP pyrophosphatase n=1 Tax=mine drainage metagenome TaxID=410659 RepID=T1C2Z3_9ZZZZ
MRLVLATGNPGKCREFASIVSAWGFVVVPQAELGIESPPETGSTFYDNAMLKAAHARSRCTDAVLADDSGLEVNALGGEPGVNSACYAGPDANASANLDRLLHNLSGTPLPDRTAHFRCILVLWPPDQEQPFVAEGSCQGRILNEPRGNRGFGYDPVFELPELGLTFGQLSTELKDRYSHRGHALRQLRHKITGSEWYSRHPELFSEGGKRSGTAGW